MKKLYCLATGLSIFLMSCSYNVSSFVMGPSGYNGYSRDSGANDLPDVISSLAVDSYGNLFLSDRKNNRIKEIDSNGKITTYAGSGKKGNSDGTKLEANFDSLGDLVIDTNSTIYVTESSYNIRKIHPDGKVETLKNVADGGVPISICGLDRDNNLYYLGREIKDRNYEKMILYKLNPDGNIEKIHNVDIPQGNDYVAYCMNFNKNTNDIFINVPSINYGSLETYSESYILNIKPSNNKDTNSIDYENLNDISSIDYDKNNNLYILKDMRVYKLLANSNYKDKIEIASFQGLGFENGYGRFVIDRIKNIIYVFGFNKSSEIFKVQIKE